MKTAMGIIIVLSLLLGNLCVQSSSVLSKPNEKDETWTLKIGNKNASNQLTIPNFTTTTWKILMQEHSIDPNPLIKEQILHFISEMEEYAK